MVSPTGGCGSAFMVGMTGGMHEDDKNSDFPLTETPAAQTENSELDVHHFDEGRVALLDTACTACMHSRAWRLAFEKSLPPDAVCQPTPLRKTFHFANGASSSEKLVVWRIPIFLGGFRGEVHSAEVPEGNTPLLLSIAAMSALDMVIRLKKQIVEVNRLSLELPMLITRTKHLAVQVAFDANVPLATADPSSPRAVSDRGDLMVYYTEESCFSILADLPFFPDDVWKPTHGGKPVMEPRGLRPGDVHGMLTKKRSHELALAAAHIRKEDRRVDSPAARIHPGRAMGHQRLSQHCCLRALWWNFWVD